MMNAESLALVGVATVDLNWLTAPWTAPGADVERDFGLVETAAGEVAGYFLIDADPPYETVFSIGTVAHDHHGRGVGTAILDEVERRAAAFDGIWPRLIRAGTLSDEPRASRLLAEHGYREERRLWEMRIVFDAPPRPPAHMPGIDVRTIREGEEQQVYDCMAEAFQDHWGEGFDSAEVWLHRHTDAAVFDPSLWFVAVEDGAVVGALVGYLAAAEDPELGMVHTLGVRRAARARGIGEALLRASFAAFAERGRSGVLLHVDSESLTGATRLYERVGMTAQPRFSTWCRSLSERP